MQALALGELFQDLALAGASLATQGTTIPTVLFAHVMANTALFPASRRARTGPARVVSVALRATADNGVSNGLSVVFRVGHGSVFRVKPGAVLRVAPHLATHL